MTFFQTFKVKRCKSYATWKQSSGQDLNIVHIEQNESYLYRGSDMSAHVLLSLLKELGKSYKMRGLQSILSLFRQDFNKFNNTGARMLDSIYHRHKNTVLYRMLIVSIQRDFSTENFFLIKIICTGNCKFATHDLLTISISNFVHHSLEQRLDGHHIYQYDNYILHKPLFMPRVMPKYNFIAS